VSAINAREGRTFGTGADGDRTRIFRKALRHSRRVRALRIGVPAGVIVGLTAFAVISWFNPLRMFVKLPGLGNLVVSGTKITMQTPKVQGYTREGRAYELTARAASQDITAPDRIELQDAYAKIELEDRSVVEMRAASGLYDSKTEILMLRQDILLTTTDGNEAKLIEATIDVRKGYVVSEKPVAIKTTNAVLNANSLEIFEGGDILRFGGGVAMTLTPEPDADGAR
jgi:lipopolysaccharide export system protein LptC